MTVKKRFLILTCLGIFIVPLSSIYPVGPELWYPQFLALFSFFSIGIIMAIWDTSKGLALMNIVALFSVIFVSDHSPRGIILFVQFLLSCFSIHIISKINRKYFKWIIFSIIGIFIIQSLWATLQHFKLDPIFDLKKDITNDDTVGFSGSHNQLGVFFASTGPLVLFYSPFLFPLTLWGLWCSTTSTAWVAYILSSSLMITHFTDKWVCLIIILLILTASTAFFIKVEKLSSESFRERREIAINSIKAVINGHIVMRVKQFPQNFNSDIDSPILIKPIKCHPFFGFGFGNFIRISPHTQKPYLVIPGEKEKHHHVYEHAHNDIVEWVFETGYVGAAALFLAFIEFIWAFVVANKTKILMMAFFCIFSHFITSLGVYAVHTAVSGIFLIIWLGLFWGEIKHEPKTGLV